MSDDDAKRLRALAERATPGPWMRLFGERTVYDRMSDGCRGIPIVRSDHSPPMPAEADNLDYIAAASPDVLLRLLDEIEALRRERDEVCTWHAAAIFAQSKAEHERDAALAANLDAMLHFDVAKSERDAALALLRSFTADGYCAGMCRSEPDGGGSFTLHYRTTEQAERAFYVATSGPDALLGDGGEAERG